MIEIRNDVVFSMDHVDLHYVDSDFVIFFCNDTGINIIGFKQY